ncbi:MAG: PQQ-binding-like beta-propeller repeat protein [Gemmataceae bacterium]
MRGLSLGWLTTLVCGLSAARADDKPDTKEETVQPARLGAARFLNVGRVFSLAYARDGQFLASGAWDGSIRVWNLASGAERWKLQGHDGQVDALAFSPDGALLVSGGREAGVCLWNLATGKLIRRLGENQESATMVAFSPDGKQVGAIVRGALHLWDAATGKEIWRQGGDRVHRSFAFLGSTEVISIAIQPVKRFREQLVPVPESRLDLVVWDLKTGKTRGPSRRLEPVVINRDTTWNNVHAPIAIGHAGKPIAILDSYSYSTGESNVDILDVDARKPARHFKVNRQDITLMCLSPDGRMLASAGNARAGDGSARVSSCIQIWEVATGRERCYFRSPDEGKTILAFSPDVRTMACGSLDTTVLLWDLTGQETAHGKRAPVRLTATDLDGLWNALKGEDAANAYRAIWKLALAPKDALPFLSKHLHAAKSADAERIQRLIQDLADERFDARDKAARELAGYRQLAEPALRQAVGKAPRLEVCRRLEQLLERLQTPSPEELQEMRAVEAVEHMRSPEVEKLLHRLAGGAPAAALTQDAQASLERLRARKVE